MEKGGRPWGFPLSKILDDCPLNYKNLISRTKRQARKEEGLGISNSYPIFGFFFFYSESNSSVEPQI